jgi:hypothetical protein
MVTMMSYGFMLIKQLDPDVDEHLYGTMLAAFMLGLREMWRVQDPEAVRRAEERIAAMEAAQN